MLTDCAKESRSRQNVASAAVQSCNWGLASRASSARRFVKLDATASARTGHVYRWTTPPGRVSIVARCSSRNALIAPTAMTSGATKPLTSNVEQWGHLGSWGTMTLFVASAESRSWVGIQQRGGAQRCALIDIMAGADRGAEARSRQRHTLTDQFSTVMVGSAIYVESLCPRSTNGHTGWHPRSTI